MNASNANMLGFAAMNITRLANLGYGDSRVGSLTTPQTLIDDIATFGATLNPSKAPIWRAAQDSIRWAVSADKINTTLVTALTTVNDSTVSATTDLWFIFGGDADKPAWIARGDDDVSVSIPNGAA